MTIEDQTNRVKDLMFSEIERSKTIVFDGLLNDTHLNSMPESLFINYFLPCFLGKPVSNNWIAEWISIAGTPMADVMVIKDGTNEVLFIVPSILNTNNLFLHKENGDFGDIFSRYDQISSNNIPGRGLSFLLQALDSKNKELLNKINFTDVNKRWYDILSRYNLLPNVADSNNTNNVSDDNYFEE